MLPRPRDRFALAEVHRFPLGALLSSAIYWRPSLEDFAYAFFHVFRGWLLVELGQLEEAGRLIEQGWQLAREHGDVEVVAWNHLYFTWLAHFQREPRPRAATPSGRSS